MHAALARNFALLQPLSAAALVNSASGSGAGAQAPLPGLLAVHIRRGDYERHCARLAAWGSLYMGFNEFPGLPDTFDPRPYASPSAAPNASRAAAADADADAPPQGETRLGYYMRHCLPSAAQVAARLHAVRAAHPAGTAGGLRRVFVLTNAGWAWRRALERALRADGWADVRAGADLVLDAEQRYVAMAVDMAIAERAEVFVGNGVRTSPDLDSCWRVVVADRVFGVGWWLVLELDGEYRDAAAGARDGGGEQPLPVRLGSPRHTSRARTRTRARARTRRSYHIISYHLQIISTSSP